MRNATRRSEEISSSKGSRGTVALYGCFALAVFSAYVCVRFSPLPDKSMLGLYVFVFGLAMINISEKKGRVTFRDAGGFIILSLWILYWAVVHILEQRPYAGNGSSEEISMVEFYGVLLFGTAFVCFLMYDFLERSEKIKFLGVKEWCFIVALPSILWTVFLVSMSWLYPENGQPNVIPMMEFSTKIVTVALIISFCCLFVYDLILKPISYICSYRRSKKAKHDMSHVDRSDE